MCRVDCCHCATPIPRNGQHVSELWVLRRPTEGSPYQLVVPILVFALFLPAIPFAIGEATSIEPYLDFYDSFFSSSFWIREE